MSCRGCMEDILVLINAFGIVLGLAILGYSAYLASVFDDAFKDVGAANPVIVALVMGVGIFIFAIIGLIGAKGDNKLCLLVYMVGLLAMSIGIITSGVILLYFSGDLKEVGDGDLDNDAQARILDFEIALFSDCCSEFITDLTVQNCDDAITETCISDEGRFEDFKDAITKNTCAYLEDVDVDGHPLVGDVTDGACGGIRGTRGFVEDVSQYMEENMKPFATFTIIAGCITFVLLLASCYVFCTSDRDSK